MPVLAVRCALGDTIQVKYVATGTFTKDSSDTASVNISNGGLSASFSKTAGSKTINETLTYAGETWDQLVTTGSPTAATFGGFQWTTDSPGFSTGDQKIDFTLTISQVDPATGNKTVVGEVKGLVNKNWEKLTIDWDPTRFSIPPSGLPRVSYSLNGVDSKLPTGNTSEIPITGAVAAFGGGSLPAPGVAPLPGSLFGVVTLLGGVAVGRKIRSRRA